MAVKIDTSIDSAELDAIKARTDNLAGQASIESSVVGNWNSGVATSGSTGDNLVSIGAVNIKYKLHCLIIDIGLLTSGSTITIRLYMKVNGTEIQIYPPITQSQTFVVGTDARGIWVINGSVMIDQVLRVEVMSNNAIDNRLPVAYKVNLEAM